MDTKALRQRILDLAIRGKLVPQDPNDEPASVLLDRICAEKERLIAEGKIKRPKKSKASSAESHYQNFTPPFDIPASWQWVTVDNLSISILYGVSESAKKEGDFKLLRITDIQDNKVNWDNVPYTSFPVEKANAYLLSDGDILFARTGATVGKSYLVKGITQKSVYASYLIRVQTSKNVMPEYVKLFFESGYYWEQIAQNSVGVGQPNVNGTILGNLNIPLPSYSEQKRIVEECSRWLSFITIIENGKKDLSSALGQAKSKILDLAIHGKLVPQNPEDEPAADLLRRVNPNARIITDNPHYPQLPDNWVLTNVESIAELLSGRDLASHDCNEDRKGLPYLIGASNIVNGGFNVNRWTLSPQVVSIYGDILISCKGTIGEMITNHVGNVHIARQFMAIRPSHTVDSRYLYYAMEAALDDIKKKANGIIPGISRPVILSQIIALPPLQEQRRIVRRIKEYLYSVNIISSTL